MFIEIIEEPEVIHCPVCGCALEVPNRACLPARQDRDDNDEEEIIIELGEKDVKSIRDDDYERFGASE